MGQGFLSVVSESGSLLLLVTLLSWRELGATKVETFFVFLLLFVLSGGTERESGRQAGQAGKHARAHTRTHGHCSWKIREAPTRFNIRDPLRRQATQSQSVSHSWSVRVWVGGPGLQVRGSESAWELQISE